MLSPEELAAAEELAAEHDAEQAAQAQEPAADAGAAGAAGASPMVATTSTVYLQADVDRPALPKGEATPATGVGVDIAPEAGAAPGSAAGAAEGAPGSASRSEGAAQTPGSAAGGIPDWWHLREEIAAAAAADATAAARSGDPEAARRAIDLIFARLGGRVDLGEEASPQDLTEAEEIAHLIETLPPMVVPPVDPGRRSEDSEGAEVLTVEPETAQEAAAAAAEPKRVAWADVSPAASPSDEVEELRPPLSPRSRQGMPEVSAAQQAQEAKAAFDKRMLNKRPLDEPAPPAGGADAPAAGAAVCSPPKAKGPPVKEPPGQPSFQQPPPPVWQGSSGDAAVPVKAKPCAYTDYRYAGPPPADAALHPGAAAQEHAALLAAAHRRADAAGPARDKPYGAQEINYAFREPPNPWQLDQGKPADTAMVGKGKGKAYQPTPFGDPWSGMVARSSKGMGKGDPKGKGKEGKGDKRPVAGCTRCGGFFVCQKAAEGKGLGEEHCTNPKCERSLEYARLGVEDKKTFLAANLAIRESEAAAARLAATRAEAKAVSAGVFAQSPAAGAAATPGAAAHVVIDVDAYSPLTPPGAAAAAGQSDTDVSSPAGEPVGQAAQAPGPASRRPPTKAPSPAQMAAMAAARQTAVHRRAYRTCGRGAALAMPCGSLRYPLRRAPS